MPPRRKTATNQGDRPGPGTALSGRRVSLAVQNTSEWEQVNTAISTTVRGHIPSAEDVEKQRVLSHYCIGYVCFQWGGPGSVDGYFPSSTDPNIRINPRPINPDALSKLLVSIARTGVRDRANPIFAKIKRSSIPEHLLPQISSVNVADLTVPIPLLDIKRRLPERERELELELLTEYRDGNLLSEEELERARDELDDLRNERKAEDLVKLVNGQHRMQVMNLRWTEVNERRVELINQVKRNEFDGDLVKEWEIINNLISGLKYTVKLFDDDTPEHLLVELAENEDAKPMAPASGGEKIWAACSKQETNINKLLLSHKIKDRVEGLNMLNGMKERRIEFGQSISYDEERLLKLIGKVPNAPAPIPVKRGKGDGEDSILEGMCGLAMGHPATMEMACDTRYILPIWSKRIKESHVKAMIKDLGASFIAHVWLGLLYAHRICAIDHGVGFEEAKEFIHRNEKLGLDRSGLDGSVLHWNNIHQGAGRVAGWLNDYEDELHDAAQSFVNKSFRSDDWPIGEIDYSSDGCYQTMRSMREHIGLSLESIAAKRLDDRLAKIGLSMRLSARLPPWTPGCGTDRIFPGEMIPTRGRIQAYTAAVNKCENNQSGMVMLEYLMDPFQVIWQAGSSPASTSQNTGNWYGRARGFHQILLGVLNMDFLGSVPARLQKAISLLEDPTLKKGLKMASQHIGDFSQLTNKCGAIKSGTDSFPILDRLLQLSPRPGIKRATLEANLKNAAKLLASAAYKESSRDKFLTILISDPSLDMVDSSFWSGFDFYDWLLGWHDGKHQNTVTYGLGWALLYQYLKLDFIPSVLHNCPQSRYIANAIQGFSSLDQRHIWWEQLGFETDISVADAVHNKAPGTKIGLSVPQKPSVNLAKRHEQQEQEQGVELELELGMGLEVELGLEQEQERDPDQVQSPVQEHAQEKRVLGEEREMSKQQKPQWMEQQQREKQAVEEDHIRPSKRSRRKQSGAVESAHQTRLRASTRPLNRRSPIPEPESEQKSSLPLNQLDKGKQKEVGPPPEAGPVDTDEFRGSDLPPSEDPPVLMGNQEAQYPLKQRLPVHFKPSDTSLSSLSVTLQPILPEPFHMQATSSPINSNLVLQAQSSIPTGKHQTTSPSPQLPPPTPVCIHMGEHKWVINPEDPFTELHDFAHSVPVGSIPVATAASKWDPGYLASNPGLPFHQLHTAYITHQHTLLAEPDICELNATLTAEAEDVLELMQGINKCRSRFRKAIMKVAYSFIDPEDPYGREKLIWTLATRNQELKDCYMWDLASAFHQHNPAGGDGLRDATWLMHSDQVWKQQLIDYNVDERMLRVNLLSSIPLILQEKFLSELVRRMDRMFPLLSYGTTRANMVDHTTKGVYMRGIKHGPPNLIFAPHPEETERALNNYHSTNYGVTAPAQIQEAFGPGHMEKFPHPVTWERAHFFTGEARDRHPYSTGDIVVETRTNLDEESLAARDLLSRRFQQDHTIAMADFQCDYREWLDTLPHNQSATTKKAARALLPGWEESILCTGTWSGSNTTQTATARLPTNKDQQTGPSFAKPKLPVAEAAPKVTPSSSYASLSRLAPDDHHKSTAMNMDLPPSSPAPMTPASVSHVQSTPAPGESSTVGRYASQVYPSSSLSNPGQKTPATVARKVPLREPTPERPGSSSTEHSPEMRKVAGQKRDRGSISSTSTSSSRDHTRSRLSQSTDLSIE